MLHLLLPRQRDVADQCLDLVPAEADGTVGQLVVGQALPSGEPCGSAERPAQVAVDLFGVDEFCEHAVAPFRGCFPGNSGLTARSAEVVGGISTFSDVFGRVPTLGATCLCPY